MFFLFIEIGTGQIVTGIYGMEICKLICAIKLSGYSAEKSDLRPLRTDVGTEKLNLNRYPVWILDFVCRI
jgi:hypothetical protein